MDIAIATRTGSPSLLPLLRSQLQASIVERLLVDARRGWTVSELAEELDVSGQAVRNELRRLARAGIADESQVGRVHVFRDPDSPVFEPLRTLIERTVGVERRLREALAVLPGIEAALIYGSWAAGDVDSRSDIDLLVVGDIDHAALVDAIAEVQERSHREVNLVAISPDELRRRAQDGSGFIRSILDGPKLPLIGRLGVEQGSD